MSARRHVGVFVLALVITGWNCGNVGPVVGPLTEEFDLSLSEVGLLSGTFFFAGAAIAALLGAGLATRIRILWGVRACCMLSAVGNLLIAVGDSFAVLGAGRVIAGLAFGGAAVFVPAYARAMGGVRLLGLFGAGLTLGVAASLFLGSVMVGEGVDWRVAFVITALLALVSLPILPNEQVETKRAPLKREGLAREALTSGAWWRVELLGNVTLDIPLVVGAWLVHYLTVGDGLSASIAGALGFGLFGISALMRELAGRMSAAGTSPSLLVVGGLTAAAAGLVLLGQGRSVGVVMVAIALIGIGLSLPYPLYYDEAERVLPDRPIGSLGLLQVGNGVFPIPVVPLFGAALASGDADLAFAALAAFTLLTTLLNARPAVPPADPDRSQP